MDKKRKLFGLFVAVFALGLSVNHATGQIHLWSERYGDTALDRGFGITGDPFGNVIVTGIFKGTVDFGGGALTSAGNFDIFLAKYDARGSHVWSRRYLPRSLVYAETYDLMGDKEQARTHYESSRRLLEAKAKEDPDDPRFHRSLGVAYAGLGLRTAALEEATLATVLMPMSKDAWKGHYYLQDLARVQTMVGEYDAAIDLLDYLLSIPGEMSAPLLALEPKWTPLRGEPRFQELLAKYMPEDS